MNGNIFVFVLFLFCFSFYFETGEIEFKSMKMLLECLIQNSFSKVSVLSCKHGRYQMVYGIKSKVLLIRKQKY